MPEAISNGSFETVDTGPDGCTLFNNNLGGTSGYLGAFLDGCVNNWSAAAGGPDVFLEFGTNSLPSGVEAAQDGNHFAFMDIDCGANEPCRVNAIYQNLSLVPCVQYEISLWAQSESQSLDFSVSLTNGLTPSGNNSSGEVAPTLPANSLTLLQESGPSNTQWEQYTTSFVADDINDQLIILPTNVDLPPPGDDGLFIDNITIEPCTSPLNVGFTANQSGGNTYEFFDLTSTNGTNEAEAWCWDFGDGSPVSNEQNPTHTYANAGPYEVCLTIRDTEGCIRQVCQPIDNQVSCDCQEGFLEVDGGSFDWVSDQNINNNLIIRAGSKLELKNMTLSMAPNCKIYVERGARLDVDGSTITTGCDSLDRFWSGIEVWGNGTLEHNLLEWIEAGSYPWNLTQHGVVHLKNESTISRAHIGVLTDNYPNAGGHETYWQPYGEWGSHFGGIVLAENTTFTNNRRAAHLAAFPANNLPGAPGFNVRNLSRFEDCTFRDPLDVSTGGLSIWESEDVQIKRCTFDFINNQSIMLLDAKATIGNSIFNNSVVGVQTLHTAAYTAPEFDVKIGGTNAGNEFNNCFVGVAAETPEEWLVENNDFDNCFAALIVSGPSRYNVSGNTFENSSLRAAQLRNTFRDLADANFDCNTYISTSSEGIMALGDNLEFLFNHEDFDLPNSEDVIIRRSGSINGQINPAQGSQSQPHLNLFSGTENIIAPAAEAQSFRYFHPGDNLLVTYPELEPDNTGQNFVNIPIDLPLDEIEDGCLNLPGVGPLQEEDEPCNTRACLDTAYQKLREIASLIDGGDTEGLINALQNAPAATATYQDLLAASPYLSDEVLQALLDSGIAAAKRDTLLLQAAPLSKEAMDAAHPIVSAAVYQLLENSRQSTGYSPMDEKIAERTHWQGERSRILWQLLKTYLQQDSIAMAEELLEQDSSVEATRTLIGLKLRQQDYSSARTYLNTLPDQTAGEQRINTMLDLEIDYYEEGDSFALTQLELEQLYEIADDTLSAESGYARAFLGLTDQAAFLPAIAPPYSPQQQMQGVPLPPVAETASVSKPLKLVPNPASEEVNVRLPQAEGEWELQLWDISGRPARSWQIQGETAPTLNLQGLPKGLYVLHGLSPDGQPYQSKLVVE
ncbi:MAG: PKD domain-containing protein [Bacteroidetes bacterium]|jgi:hypothetical protein|nr:PKD domain-containing protein [Bacteroidota bacterium]